MPCKPYPALLSILALLLAAPVYAGEFTIHDVEIELWDAKAPPHPAMTERADPKSDPEDQVWGQLLVRYSTTEAVRDVRVLVYALCEPVSGDAFVLFGERCNAFRHEPGKRYDVRLFVPPGIMSTLKRIGAAAAQLVHGEVMQAEAVTPKNAKPARWAALPIVPGLVDQVESPWAHLESDGAGGLIPRKTVEQMAAEFGGAPPPDIQLQPAPDAAGGAAHE